MAPFWVQLQILPTAQLLSDFHPTRCCSGYFALSEYYPLILPSNLGDLSDIFLLLEKEITKVELFDRDKIQFKHSIAEMYFHCFHVTYHQAPPKGFGHWQTAYAMGSMKV